MRTAEEAIEWIHSLLPFGIKPGLKRMEWMLERLDHPERSLQMIHIGGTNGKGSTVSYLRYIIEENGYNVGTFTSPYIHCFEERISYNGQPIEGEDLVQCANLVKPLVEQLAESDLGSPTEFEVITTIGFLYFAKLRKLDFVLVEVGLGGRLDSTNVIEPILSIITSIGHDHMHILGDSLTKIASEKAGIIKPCKPVISGVTQEEAQLVLRDAAKDKQAAFKQLNADFKEELLSRTETSQLFRFQSSEEEFQACAIQMAGDHQRSNAALAIEAIVTLKQLGYIDYTEEACLLGLQKANWAGRFELIGKQPTVILDGAHNEEGMVALASTLQAHYPTKRYRIIMAATKEKDMGKLLIPFKHLDVSFTFTTFDFFRAAGEAELFEQADVSHKTAHSNWKKAVDQEVRNCLEDELVVVSGSLYFVSDVRKWLIETQEQRKLITTNL
ncbi:bifunctional folylpolyglutamate synthase/dihydrofolate synthase [Bacillus sp. FJAT-45037]|uniref:bifunctional folylpolyglutamate synthase/dihydrofolate synthase n=1 Tax=Bacillus sp. FJAT-45037 TaxID=2011007 RepID=UPI000C235F10|nr:folylpolyglutamate synthase/dihydrofolate synthase family protein [Bacillus sp. FJAT-45037]